MDKERDTYRDLMGKSDRKSSLGTSMHGKEGNIKWIFWKWRHLLDCSGSG
jgi:hypothetical protein